VLHGDTKLRVSKYIPLNRTINFNNNNNNTLAFNNLSLLASSGRNITIRVFLMPYRVCLSCWLIFQSRVRLSGFTPSASMLYIFIPIINWRIVTYKCQHLEPVGCLVDKIRKEVVQATWNIRGTAHKKTRWNIAEKQHKIKSYNTN
jgi:hypothetical protein